MPKANQNVAANESISIMDSWLSGLNVSHHGLTLDATNVTPEALTYFVSMGMAQSFLDVGSVNYSNIAGIDSNGNTPAGAWDIAKCRKHATRLGLTSFDGSIESRKTLAETWIADARNSKWTRILNGELVHDGESRGPRLNPVDSFVYDAVAESILNAAKADNKKRAKTDQRPLPKGKILSDMVDLYMSNPDKESTIAKLRELGTLKAALTV